MRMSGHMVYRDLAYCFRQYQPQPPRSTPAPNQQLAAKAHRPSAAAITFCVTLLYLPKLRVIVYLIKYSK